MGGLELLGKRRKECAKGTGPLRAERAGASESPGKYENGSQASSGRREKNLIRSAFPPGSIKPNLYPPLETAKNFAIFRRKLKPSKGE
jgi:hypothetical protein